MVISRENHLLYSLSRLFGSSTVWFVNLPVLVPVFSVSSSCLVRDLFGKGV